MEKVNLSSKLKLFNDQWHPKIIGELNGQHVKLAKIQGEFVWHSHENEDEMFYVIKGQLSMAFRDKTIVLKEGEMLIVPKGIEHRPVAEEECHIMLFEPATIKHTGEVEHALTVKNCDRL